MNGSLWYAQFGRFYFGLPPKSTFNFFTRSGLLRTLEVERHEMNCERRAGWISPAKRGNSKVDFGGKPNVKFHNGRKVPAIPSLAHQPYSISSSICIY